MDGQGSPHYDGPNPRWPLGLPCRNLRRLGGYARGVALAWLLQAAVPAWAEPVDLRLWIAWGGGTAQLWQGEVRIEDGTAPAAAAAEPAPAAPLSDLQPVGLNADDPGSMVLDRGVLRIAPGTPRSYDAVILRVQAAREATLLVRLWPLDQPDALHESRVPLTRLVSEPHTAPMDGLGNQVYVQRAPGDTLRIRLERDRLIFAPGERFEFTLEPHLVGVEPNSTLACEIQLNAARSFNKLWGETRDLTADATGAIPAPTPISIPLPEAEGVYDVTIALNRRRLPTRFSPTKTVAQRSLQLVVLAAEPPAAAPAGWTLVKEVAPRPDELPAASEAAKSKRWPAIPKLPHWSWIPGSGTHDPARPLGNGKARASARRPDTAAGRVELLPGGWQAYPLPVRAVHVPHLVELEYSPAVAQTLGISILEADAAGIVIPTGVHSGLDVTPLGKPVPARSERHQLIFWPRTENPLLLLTNPRADLPAEFGTVRVLSGPAAPPPSFPVSGGGNERLFGAYFDRPLFMDSFSAGDTLDPLTGRTLMDWLTFYQGGQRFAEYLQFAGYNSAMVSVVHEGGTIYPSQLLEPTPRYDNGVFSSAGQDPVRKDVLELLFRLFDRQQLTLIPVVHLNMPLPELERLVRSPGGSRAAARQAAAVPSGTAASSLEDSLAGIEMTAPGGRLWRESRAAGVAAGPYYNPLHPVVQQAIRRVVVELVDRYAGHASFGGLAIRLSPASYAMFPDADWGLDGPTIGRFAAETKLTLPADAAGDPRRLALHLNSENRAAWMDWRARKLAEFYRRVQADVTDRAPRARLYLAGPDMLSATSLQAELRPRLPEQLDPEQLLLRVGISPHKLAESPQLVLLRPGRFTPLASLEAQAASWQLSPSASWDALFGLAASPLTSAASPPRLRPLTGSLLFQDPLTLAPASFQNVSPFGPEATSSWFLAQISPSGLAYRRRFVRSLATLDSQVMFDGGWQIPLGQQAAWSDFLSVYRRLPAARFETVPANSSGEATSPVTVRRLSTRDATWVYLANDAPWPASVTLELDEARPFTLEPLGNRTLPPLTRTATGLQWSVPMEPYDLVAARLSATEVKIRDWRAETSNEAVAELSRSVEEVRRRVGQLKERKPLAVLTNPDFETVAAGGGLVGWEHARGEGVKVEAASGGAHRGQHALRIQSSGPVVWVRSNPFPAPRTGRLSVWVWLKISDAARQPPLRLAIEGRLNGDTYYRPARLGAAADPTGPSPPSLTTEWSPFLVRVDNLPTDGLSDLRVAIDLMGAGDVWLDSVQVYDLWFDKTELNELIKMTALANFCLGKGAVVDCHRMLSGYWPEFLRRHVSPDDPDLVAAPLTGTPPPASGNPPPATPAPAGGASAEQPPASTSWLQRLVPKAPRIPNPFR